jgi:hypothetical protein
MSDPKYIWLSPDECDWHEDGGRYWLSTPDFECEACDHDPKHIHGKPARYEIAPERETP